MRKSEENFFRRETFYKSATGKKKLENPKTLNTSRDPEKEKFYPDESPL
jgi:hypothetical protein